MMKQSELDAIMSRNPQLKLDENNNHNTGTDAKLESTPRYAPLGEDKAKKEDTGRVHIRLLSVRKRLLDEDNLSPKQLVDCLRYGGIIQDDCPEKTSIQVSQRKVQKGEAEHTRIDIYYGEQQPITSYE